MRRRVLAAAVAFIAIGGIALASASTLGVDGPTVTGHLAEHPCPGTAATTASNIATPGTQTFRGISVTLPDGCGSRAVQATVLNGTTVLASGSGTLDGGGVLTASTTYTAAPELTVQLTVDGWDLPATWEYRQYASCAVTSGSGSCTAEVTLWTGTRPGGTSEALYFDVWVRTTSTSWVPWSVTFDLSHSYYGTTVTRLGNSTLDGYSDGSTTWSNTGWANNAKRSTHCSLLPTLTVVGVSQSTTSTRNFAVVRNTRPRYFSLVVNRTEAGYFDVLAPGCGAPPP